MPLGLYLTTIFTRKGPRSLHKIKIVPRKTSFFFLQLGKTWNRIPRCQENANFSGEAPPCVPFFRGCTRSRNPGSAPDPSAKNLIIKHTTGTWFERGYYRPTFWYSHAWSNPWRYFQTIHCRFLNNSITYRCIFMLEEATISNGVRGKKIICNHATGRNRMLLNWGNVI
jgi:hypothetical protein